MEEIIERIQDEIFLIFMLLLSFSVFMYIITEKLSFISMFLCMTVSLAAVNKESYLLYGLGFFVLGLISLIIMLDIDMWIEMGIMEMNLRQKIIRILCLLVIAVPLLKILRTYSFIRNFTLNPRSVILCIVTGAFVILVLGVVPRYMLVFLSRLKPGKKITSFFIMKAMRYRMFHGMIQSKLYVRDGVGEYKFEVSNRAYKMLRNKTYVKIQMQEGFFGTHYVKNNFLGRDRLKTLKEDIPRFVMALIVITVLLLLSIAFCHVINNYAWVG
ncbi:hypothetical protein [Sebaldella sp. S0638]|uniref:hypothetical protein n=1 Tax=Sebaldella sp. S0638 TaxID=2957809 RepID=UPI00209FBE23|nr:hypothetical protein [Sebaldella sp. S0638]MCP1222998.1 hypothetical protein [Sebaldella sp. S0638]